MTREQYLLDVLAEECAEVAQRASKAIRFGLDETQAGWSVTNRQRLEQELGDLVGVMNMLGLKPDLDAVAKKAEKVERYMGYSRDLGLVE